MLQKDDLVKICFYTPAPKAGTFKIYRWHLGLRGDFRVTVILLDLKTERSINKLQILNPSQMARGVGGVNKTPRENESN